MRINWTLLTTALAMFFSAQALAATYGNDFTQANDNTVDWTPLSFNGYPCLTAGTAVNNTAASSSLPGCNWATPDAAGSGALRLNPAQNNQHSAILTQGVFPTNQGLQVTFTTYTYGGDSGGPANNGADGLSFFLVDGSLPQNINGSPNLGAYGGSLGYACANNKTISDGLEGAYLGLGMDTYGNFLNSGDNTATGIAAQLVSSGTNPNLSFGTFSDGPFKQANRIGLRGAGNVSWHWLNQYSPLYYPATLSASAQQAAVRDTCRTGTLWDYRNAVINNITALALNNANLTVTAVNHGYANGTNVNIAGVVTATPIVKNISNVTSTGTTATITVTDATGFANAETVTIGGTVKTTQGITSIGSYSSGPPKTVRVTPVSISGYSVGQSVTIAGVTGGTNSTGGAVTAGSSNNNFASPFTIQSVNLGYFTIVVPNNPGSVNVTAAAVTAYVPVSNTVANLNVGASTFNITLPFTPKSGFTFAGSTITGATPNVPGTYTIANATANTFDVTLSNAAATVNNTSASVQGTGSVAQLATTVRDYAVIPGGFWVLPDATKIANEGALTRAGGAWPITYKLRITPGGLLTYMYSFNGGAYQPVLSNWNITTSNGPVPASFRFGFAASTGGSTNVSEIACFVAEPILSNSSASGNVLQGQQVRTGSKVFFAAYDPNSWSGSVSAFALVKGVGTVTVAATADWDTSCVLTGGACRATGVTSTAATAQGSSNRNILTYNGTTGIPLQWTTLTTAQKAVLNSTDTAGQDRLNWLRGDQSKEQTATPTPGLLRARSGVLGDVVDSGPTWVGPPSQNFAYPFNDTLYASSNATAAENITTAQTYRAFASNNATRTHVVYTGSNDGMLHGSRAGSSNADGSYNATNNDGMEVLGFMPSSVLASSKVVDLTSPTYGHNYFVDATPGYGDLFYGGKWHTWMVGGLGAGGAEVYALNITNPDITPTAVITDPNFSETNASTIVVGDWTPSSLTTCTKFTGACGAANMGSSYGTPIIRRLHNGKWAIIFGNGIGSTNNSAGVFIGLVDPSTGAVSNFYWLDTYKNGTVSNPNGIAYISSSDLDGDHITDYIYAGDLQGNIWRFDVTSSNPADWGVTDFSNPSDKPGIARASPSPLFVAKNSAGTATQPITTRIIVTKTVSAGVQRIIMGFATGQATPLSNTSSVSYATGTQTVYGLWDWNLSNWNAGVTTASGAVIPAAATPLATSASVPTTQPFTRAMLSSTNSKLTQTATNRALGINTVCWQGSSACGTNNQYGWLLDLPDTVVSGGVTTGYEQAVYNPVFSGGELLFNTTTPPAATIGQCTPTLSTGFTMAFNIESGGGVVDKGGNVVSVLGNKYTLSIYGTSIVGVKQSSVGSPIVVAIGSKTVIVSQGNNNNHHVNDFNPSGEVNVKRISWEQLR